MPRDHIARTYYAAEYRALNPSESQRRFRCTGHFRPPTLGETIVKNETPANARALHADVLSDTRVMGKVSRRLWVEAARKIRLGRFWVALPV